MRLTIQLDDDLYAMARSHAIATKTSLSKAVGNLLRHRHEPRKSDRAPEASFAIDPETLLPIVRGRVKVLTHEEIQRNIEDDDLRHLEATGFLAKQPKQ